MDPLRYYKQDFPAELLVTYAKVSTVQIQFGPRRWGHSHADRPGPGSECYISPVLAQEGMQDTVIVVVCSANPAPSPSPSGFHKGAVVWRVPGTA